MNPTPTATTTTAPAPTATPAPAPPPPPARQHRTIAPSILYFGTPVVLLTTENPDGTPNLAPMSSAWALGRTVVLGMGEGSRTAHNLADRPDLVVNLPSPDLWEAVERLAPLTGADPVPPAKRAVYRYEPDKFAAAGLTPQASVRVRPPRVAQCPLQLEARVVQRTPSADGSFWTVEAEVLHVHADPAVTVPGTQHVDPDLWSPLVYNFRHYYGLGPELGHGFRSETAALRAE